MTNSLPTDGPVRDSAGTRGSRRRKASSRGTRPPETLGGQLERRVGRLEFAEGALARLRVKVPAEGAESGRDVLTDIDVLSIDVDLRLRVSRSSAECKSGSGQSGEPVTLVWLAGFRQLLSLDRVVFVRPTISSRGRALARRLNIAVLDERTLASREEAVAWVPERFAHIDGEACLTAEARTDTQLKGLPEISGSLTGFLRHEALLADSHALLAAVGSLGAAVRRQGVLPEPCASVLSGHALTAIILAAVQDAARLDHMSERELRSRLERALTTGDPEDSNLLQLLERADALVRHVVERTHRLYINTGAQRIQLDAPSLRDAIAAAPDYLEDYLDFVARMRANPLVARDLLQTAELAAFDGLLGGNAWRSDAFAHLFTVEHQGLLIAAVRCLASVGGIEMAGPVQKLTTASLTRPRVAVPDRRGAPTSPTSRTGEIILAGEEGEHQATEGASHRDPRRSAPDDGQATLL